MLASIIIPTKNRVSLLERCLQRLISMDMPAQDMEIIVVDDGSTDETSARVLYIAKESRISLRLLKGKGRGPAVARNIGWRAAKAPIILFTDDDCEPSNTWASELVDFLNENTNFGGVGGEIRRLHESLAARFTDDLGCMLHPGSNLDAHYLISANAAYRLDVLKLVNGFSENFPCAGGEDPELSFRVRKQDIKLAKIPNALVLHNHPSSLLGIYRMHQRYGRGALGLAALGYGGSKSTGKMKNLCSEITASFQEYIFRRDLTIMDRLIFCFYKIARCVAFFQGYRYQASINSIKLV
jgi:glycosyltransferase involved in cell wall biosynthesis